MSKDDYYYHKIFETVYVLYYPSFEEDSYEYSADTLLDCVKHAIDEDFSSFEIYECKRLVTKFEKKER